MRPATRRLLGTALVALSLAGTCACGEATPTASSGPTASTSPTRPADPAASAAPSTSGAAGASAGPTPSAGARDPKTAACDAVTKARSAARQALAPVAAALVRSGLSRDDLAKATNDLNTAYTAMHLGVAAAADFTDDPQLKAKISAYQLAVEQAIVAVEGSDGEQAKLAAVIELPELRNAEKALESACP
jgi:hypothetical protein